ncbi:hypothetical protein [Planotetraspora sp. GP83]
MLRVLDAPLLQHRHVEADDQRLRALRAQVPAEAGDVVAGDTR